MPVQLLQPCDAKLVDALAVETGFELNTQDELARGFARLWVARVGPDSIEPDGFLLAWIAADELHIIAIGTRPTQRRRGLGRQLVLTLIEFARSNHSRLLILEVRRSNMAAIALYRSFGFSVSRLRRGYYANPTEDGIEMQLVLDEQGDIVTSVDEVPCLEVLECPT
ncbi:MAG TPA: GNAT family N-acetyltransferase [Polyangiaceae bacterium]|nr:GNAT family N-acetyltransferase [Polyangiaceae bacterium]